jgi:t-SNARE syntaxin family protein
VGDIGEEIEDMHQQLNQTVSKAPLAHPDSFGAAEGEEDDEYGQFQEQRQMEMMHEQDQALDGVFQTVGNLRLQADTMGRELEEQADMLDDVDNITERVGGKLQTGMKKINYVIRKNEGKFAEAYMKNDLSANRMTLDTFSSCCIGVLIFVLIILLVLAITI